MVGGIPRLGRAAVYKKRALYKRKKNATAAKAEPKAATKTKQVGGDKVCNLSAEEQG
jgi:large subunit ribosomal protein L6e